MTKTFARRVLHSTGKRYAHYRVRRTGFWFVDIPRTSSTSIRDELGKAFGIPYAKRNRGAIGELMKHHTTAAQARRVLGENLWDSLYTFTIVRNPWDRTLSLYRRRKKMGTIPTGMTFRAYVQALGAATEETPLFKYHGFWLGAADYVLGENGEILVDFVARFEHRAEDLTVIGQRIGLPTLGKHEVNRTALPGDHYSVHYDTEMQHIIAQRYKKDIELFGYRFEESPIDAL